MLHDRRTFFGLGAGALLPTVPRQDAGRADLDALAERMRATERAELLRQAQAWDTAGASWRDLLGAVFLAGIRDVEPRPVGFQFHCVLMTSSAFQIAESVPDPERIVPALFNLDDFKAAQARDAQRGDWVLPRAPDVAAGDQNAARAALRAALEARDGPAADRAATALWRSSALDAAFEVLWPYGARDFADIGHHAIFTAQSYRTLQQIGWRHGEDVLRSLVHGLLGNKPDASDVSFVGNRERAAKLRRALVDGEPSLPASLELLGELRAANADGAGAAVGKRLEGGTGMGVVLDALRLHAGDLMQRLPGILAVHALTSVNALRYAAERSRVPATRALMVLQAASWQVLYRDFLQQQHGFAAKLPGLETITPCGETTDAAAVFQAAGKDPRAAAPAALRAAADLGFAPLAAEVRHWLVRKAHEHHAYKFAAALLEEMELAHPDVAARMLAGSLAYLHKPGDPDGEVWKLVNG